MRLRTMGIKAVIMDGDGSTITNNNKLPNSLKQLIIDNQQIKWIMATGRSLELLKKTPIVDYLSSDVVHIVDGGSCLMDLNAACKIRHLISIQELDLLFSKLDLESINFLYYSPDGLRSYVYSGDKNIMYNFKFHDEYVNYTNEINIFQEWTYKYPPGKILLNAKNKFNISGMYFHQNENNYDITADGINKGSACVELLNELGLQASEVAFVFNDKNDLPIVENKTLKEILKIKVGDQLPNTCSDFCVNTPYDVANVLKSIIL